MFVKNQLTELKIEDITDTGEGIGHINGFTVFVSRAVPGDTVRARIIKVKKTYAIAKAEEILVPAAGRVEPECPVAGSCGGCQLSYMSYASQLMLKQKKVEDCIRRIGGFADVPVLPILGMDNPFGYRNKGQFPVGSLIRKEGAGDGKKEPVLGFYAGHSHRIVPTKECMMLWPGHEKILAAVREYLLTSGAKPYDEETGKGLVRHVLMRRGAATGQVSVCLVVNGRSIPKAELLWESLRQIEGVVGLCLNVNTEQTNVILGRETIPLFGSVTITDFIGDVAFEISPTAFYQVNPVQMKVLYDTALSYAGLTGQETVFDLYCGIGTISLFLARKAKEVCGVEIVPDAIRDAKENAARNGICNARFYTGAAEELVSRGCFEQGVPIPRADVVVVDPPRKGCDPALLEAILRMEPDRVVYVSCDPATLARDLKTLCADGRYALRSAQPFDMFSQSCHTECVVKLVRQEPGADRE